jgi:hypothetical protein
MMRRFLVSVFLASSLATAAFADASHDRYNEDAVNRILVESDPAIAYLVRLRMMTAHLKASLAMLEAGDVDEAREHVAHPRVEIFAELEPALIKQGITDFSDKLHMTENAFKSGKLDHATEAIKLMLAAIATAESKSAPETGIDRARISVASLLLRSAVVEYKEAFEYNKLANMVEYHDGSFFVREASSILAAVAPQAKQKNAKSWEKINASLKQLQAAWPENAPPNKRVLPVTKMQALVSIIDLQLGKLGRYNEASQ